MVLHKIKETGRKGIQLINTDGTWNVMCNTRSSHITANESWNIITCKRCLKKRGDCCFKCGFKVRKCPNGLIKERHEFGCINKQLDNRKGE